MHPFSIWLSIIYKKVCVLNCIFDISALKKLHGRNYGQLFLEDYTPLWGPVSSFRSCWENISKLVYINWSIFEGSSQKAMYSSTKVIHAHIVRKTDLLCKGAWPWKWTKIFPWNLRKNFYRWKAIRSGLINI